MESGYRSGRREQLEAALDTARRKVAQLEQQLQRFVEEEEAKNDLATRGRTNLFCF